MTRDYWRTLIRPGEPVHPCDMCMAEIGEPTVVETPGDAICVRCGLIHELPGPAAAGQLTGGRGLFSSQFTPAGPFYSQNPAQDREQTGGLSGAVKAAKPTAMAVKSSPELCRRPSYTPSAPLAGRADAAPGGSHPQQAGRGNRQET